MSERPGEDGRTDEGDWSASVGCLCLAGMALILAVAFVTAVWKGG